LIKFLSHLIDPHPDITDVGDRRRAQLLAGISIILVLPLILGLIFRFISKPSDNLINYATIEFTSLIIFSLLAYFFSRRPTFHWGSIVLVVSFSLGGIINSVSSGGVAGALLFVIPAFVIGSALLSFSRFTILVLTNLVILFALPLFIPSIERTYFEIGIILTTGLLLVIVVAVRNLIEG
jgi:hypothetical protein